MKFRFTAALLLAALSISIFSGCAANAAVPVPTQPVLTVIEEPAIPLAPVPQTVPPTAPPVVPTEAPAVPTQPPAQTPERLTRDEAIAIALDSAGLTRDQVTRLEAEFDCDDGRPEYDVSFHQGGYEYDYEIHAETGKILSRDREWDD